MQSLCTKEGGEEDQRKTFDWIVNAYRTSFATLGTQNFLLTYFTRNGHTWRKLLFLSEKNNIIEILLKNLFVSSCFFSINEVELKGIKLIFYLASEGFRFTHEYGTIWYVGNPGHFNKVMMLLRKKINPDDEESWKFLPFCFQTQHSLWKQQYLLTASFSNSMHVDWRQKGFDDIDVKEF